MKVKKSTEKLVFHPDNSLTKDRNSELLKAGKSKYLSKAHTHASKS